MKFREADKGRGIKLAECPGAVEVIFATGAVNARFLLAVDPNDLIPFAPFAPLLLKHREGEAHKLAVTLRFENSVVTLA
jgi:hypothetical protein